MYFKKTPVTHRQTWPSSSTSGEYRGDKTGNSAKLTSGKCSKEYDAMLKKQFYRFILTELTFNLVKIEQNLVFNHA